MPAEGVGASRIEDDLVGLLVIRRARTSPESVRASSRMRTRRSRSLGPALPLSRAGIVHGGGGGWRCVGCEWRFVHDGILNDIGRRPAEARQELSAAAGALSDPTDGREKAFRIIRANSLHQRSSVGSPSDRFGNGVPCR